MHFLVKNLMIIYLILCLSELVIDLFKILNICLLVFSFLWWLKEEIGSLIWSITLFLTWLLILTHIVFQVNLIFNHLISVHNIFGSGGLMTSRCQDVVSLLVPSCSSLDVEVWDFKWLDLSNTWRLGFAFAQNDARWLVFTNAFSCFIKDIGIIDFLLQIELLDRWRLLTFSLLIDHIPFCFIIFLYLIHKTTAMFLRENDGFWICIDRLIIWLL